MLRQSLNGSWKFKRFDSNEILPAKVPGSVYSDLLLNNKMEDPYWRDNETEILKLSDNDYIYEKSFIPDENVMKSEKVFLLFAGLDTLADVYLNDCFLGKADNMHRMWEYDVKDILLSGENNLKVYFHSPTKYIAQKHRIDPLHGSKESLNGFGHIRKSSYMFGWDWGPRLPDMGIWKPVELLGINHARFDSVYVTQQHRENAVELHFETNVQNFSANNTNLMYSSITVVSPNGEIIAENVTNDTITISDPQLWWPNGMGDQPLYEVVVRLIYNGQELDIWKRKIGLRTITTHIEKDEYGECFAHRVNGIDIFAMGADYIPEDNILSRMNPERTRTLLLHAKNANYNCVRVWGGGFYPADAFYDACDEFGLLVWQDMMFACTAYHLNDDFFDSIKIEVEENVKRIRHHASLAMWCGNNEMELYTGPDALVQTPREKLDYIKMYEIAFPEIIKKCDPQTFYWPSSPSSGGSFDNPNDSARGDVHDWNVWHGGLPFTAYRTRRYRYLSEFGFQSFPTYDTIKNFTLPGDRNIFSYVMEKHQRNNAANGKIMGYMGQMYLYPTNFETLIYTSQILQAEAIKYGVEHFRRIRGICMGTIVWQFNDCWPTASWSSIDYYGKWKALHYYEKRFFAPLAISCCEEGLLSQNSDPNAQPYEVEKSIHLCVCNETLNDEELTVNWSLRNAKSEIKEEHSCKIMSRALSSQWLQKADLKYADLYSDYVSYELVKNHQVVSSGTVSFCMPKYFKFENPELTAAVNGEEIVIRSSAYAKSVEIRNEDDSLLLEDNYFDMNAGQRKIKIISGNPEGIKLRSIYDIGRG